MLLNVPMPTRKAVAMKRLLRIMVCLLGARGRKEAGLEAAAHAICEEGEPAPAFITATVLLKVPTLIRAAARAKRVLRIIICLPLVVRLGGTASTHSVYGDGGRAS